MKTKKNIKTEKTIQKSYIWEFCMVFCILLMLPVNISLLFSKTQTKNDHEILADSDGEGTKKVFDSALEWEVLHELARTIPIGYEMETLKAQAVILRTNILADKEEGKKDYRPVLLYAYKDKWGADYKENCQKLCEAVAQTRGMYLEKDRRPIRAAYFRLSNGSTRNAKECFSENDPEYFSVECGKDLMSYEFLQKEKLKGTEFAAKISEITGGDFSYEELERTEITYQKDSAGYVLKIKIGEKEIGGELFRRNFSLPSADFFITFEGQNVVIETKGIGTGIGFCQYGANEMAKEGEDFLKLLNCFFTNIAISKTE